MNVTRMTVVLLCVLALLGMGTLTAAASAPVGAPASAGYVDNLPHTLAANGTSWFRFEYKGDESPVILRVTDLADRNLTFTVYHPDGLAVGAGTGNDEKDVIWSGGDGVAGTYYVKVSNPNDYPIDFQLTIEGKGVTLSPYVVAPATIAEIDPARASSIDSGAVHTIPVNSSRWYKYTFGGDSQAMLTLVNGSASGLQMRIFTSEQAMKWWSETPIGVGTALSNDLVWSGSMPNGETIYIEVTNENAYVATITLNAETARLVE